METIKKNETRDDLIAPEHIAYYYAKMILAEGPVAVTEGSPAQIKLANQLRADLLSNLADQSTTVVIAEARSYAADPRAWKAEKGWSVLAQDAVDRNTLRITNVSSAKAILDRLISNEGRIQRINMHARYCKMMRGDK
jgi:hypothetical protein